MPNVLKKTVEEVVASIHGMDLDPIKFKLMNAEEGCGWSREHADRMEIEYKRFLILSVKYSREFISPSKEVDKFWHAHILDTLKYAEDCNQVFGYFLHHFPYVGLRGAEDEANRAAAALSMQRLLQQEFGDAQSSSDPSGPTSYCGIANAAPQTVVRQASYCGIAAASYCGIANAGASTEAVTEHASYCGIANDILDVTNVMNVTDRPGLPKA
jgi:hypothetical protein